MIMEVYLFTPVLSSSAVIFQQVKVFMEAEVITGH